VPQAPADPLAGAAGAPGMGNTAPADPAAPPPADDPLAGAAKQ
jgi:hypothetical protein